MDDLPRLRGSPVKQSCSYELRQEIKSDYPETQSCERDAVLGKDYCWLHVAEDDKPRSKMMSAIQDEHTNAGAILRGLDFAGDSTSFTNQYIPGADFREGNLDGVDFRGSVVAYSDFTEASLVDAKFSGAETDSTRCCFNEANCSQAEFEHSIARETSFIDSNIESGQFWNAKLERAEFSRAKARDSDFINADLRDVSFEDASLRRSNLQESHLSNSTFTGANICNSDFTNSRTYQTDLRGAAANHTTEFGKYSRYEWEADNEAEVMARMSVERHNVEATEMVLFRLYRSFGRGAARWLGSDRLYKTSRLDRAVDAYRTFQQVFRENSMPKEVRRYEIREKDADRKRQLANGNYGSWLWLAAAQKLFNYSFSPLRPLGWSLVIVGGFSVLFTLTGFQYEGVHYSTCLCFCDGWKTAVSASGTASLQTFLPGGGLGAQYSQINTWLMNIEAMLGTLLLSIFVFTLGQRVRY